MLLGGLARDTDIFEIAAELAPLHPRNNTFPGEVFLQVAADALDWAGASRADPVSGSGSWPSAGSGAGRGASSSSPSWRRPRCAGGTEPDLLDEVAWWQTDDFWQYALYAAVAFIRLAADRVGVPVSQVCRDLGHAGQVPD